MSIDPTEVPLPSPADIDFEVMASYMGYRGVTAGYYPRQPMIKTRGTLEPQTAVPSGLHNRSVEFIALEGPWNGSQ
jgi:hypothetical protein